MSEQYGDYEFETNEVAKTDGDFRRWEYMIRNTRTEKQFKYIIDITKTALSCDPAVLGNPEVVRTEGKSLVKQWLDDGREQRLHTSVGKEGFVMMNTHWKQ